ncbi:MAG TPA: thioredoxin-like domain-containing protein [Mycobacteriales bacterium]|nr:thioredoxin-like domain-containing protein [Mycobacteriales bacterium]
MTTTRHARVRAPELVGRGGWINTGGRDLTLADLRGKVVLLDFWTSCCGNCLHVLDELRPLERRFADVLVVLGVHSPKFEHEREHATVVDAVERYGVDHPVLDDPDLHTWGQYAARAWPTLALIDPEGYLVASMAGEGHADGLARIVEQLVAEHEAKGTLHRGDGPYVPPPPPATALRFPGKAIALPGGTLLVSDTAHHSLVELAGDAETVLRRIGSGRRGRTDGAAHEAEFDEPQGLLLLSPDTVLVADSVNHALRQVDLADGTVTTAVDLARAAERLEVVTGTVPGVISPWDLAWWRDRVVVAAAGVHLLLGFDPRTGRVTIEAGTTVEGLKDGAAADAWLAQPSGLAADGDRLWIADSETSALRWLDADGELHTAVGQGLFDFGHVDGPAEQALLQHPLGVCVLPDGTVAVADTYNHAIRRYDPETGEVTTIATGVREPSDVLVHRGEVLVVESAAHRLTRPVAPGAVTPVRHRTRRPTTDLAGEVTLEVPFEPAPGQKLDDRYGPATRLEVSATPPELLLEGAGTGAGLTRRLVLAPGRSGVLAVVARAASCDDGDAENPACHLTRQDWGVPIRVSAEGETRLALVLRGLGPV